MFDLRAFSAETAPIQKPRNDLFISSSSTKFTQHFHLLSILFALTLQTFTICTLLTFRRSYAGNKMDFQYSLAKSFILHICTGMEFYFFPTEI